VSRPPISEFKIVDNIFVKMYCFQFKGDTHNGHSHTFDHITLLSSGSVKMIHDNGEAEYKAPYLIVTPKGIKHQFIALEPNTAFCCIHAIRDGDGVDDLTSPEISPEQALDLLTKYSVVQKEVTP